MSRSPIIAFSGNFFFQMPEYNNAPKGKEVGFDPGLGPNAVKVIAGSDPADYFRFMLRNCKVSSVIWSDSTAKVQDDFLLGQTVDLTGFMADISPSAICAVIYAARLNIGGSATGKMDTAYQSDLRLNVRPKGFQDVTAAAHYAAKVTLGRIGSQGSAALESLLAEKDVEIIFQLNRYTDAADAAGQLQLRGLMGDIYGFIRRKPQSTSATAVRLTNRRLVAHPDIGNSAQVEKAFLSDTGGFPLVRISDIDGYYDIDLEMGSLMVRPLDFIPFLDFAYQTPTSAGIVKEYIVYGIAAGAKTDLGRFSGTREEMSLTGGVIAIPLPKQFQDLGNFTLGVDVVLPTAGRAALMAETEWDIELVSTPRGLKLPSKSAQRLAVKIYQNNRPAQNIQTSSRASNDKRSPTVADILPVRGGQSGADGVVEFDIAAKDLMNLGNIIDPVSGQVINQVPLDRQYGSAVYISIPNPLRRTQSKLEELEICVRVLLVFDAGAIKGACSFKRDVEPMFGYFTRFFPWIHTRHSGTGYRRFFDLESFESMGAHLDEIIRRLGLPDDDEHKMPRSRDLPAGVVDILKKWRADGWQP